MGCWERNQSFPWSNILLNPNSTPNSINIPSGFQPPSQYWSQSSYHNEGKNVISLPTTVTTTVDSFQSLDCLCDDNMSIVFSDYNTFRDETGNNNINLSGTSVSATVSSDNSVTKDDSVTKEIDTATNYASQPNNSFEFYQPADHNSSRSHRPRSDPVRPGRPSSSTINFRREAESGETETETDTELVVQMKEMIYRAAVFRPVSFDDGEAVERPRRRNVRISSEPQTVAARRRRERISERIRVLQKLVPGGNKMDTASMLDEAANYLKFLKSQVEAFERLGYGGCGTRGNADGTSCDARNVDCDVAVGVPLTNQSRFLQGHERVWRSSGYE